VDTDQIIPAEYLETGDPKELGSHAFEKVRPDFAKRVRVGDVIVAGDNFGCGSSREHAPRALMGCGIKCAIAKSFARIFYRNAINIGLPIFTSEEAAGALNSGDSVEVNVTKGEIIGPGRKKSFKAEVFPAFIKEIIHAGGLMEYAKKKK